MSDEDLRREANSSHLLKRHVTSPLHFRPCLTSASYTTPRKNTRVHTHAHVCACRRVISRPHVWPSPDPVREQKILWMNSKDRPGNTHALPFHRFALRLLPRPPRTLSALPASLCRYKLYSAASIKMCFDSSLVFSHFAIK